MGKELKFLRGIQFQFSTQLDGGEKIQLMQMSAGSHHPNESCALANSRLLPIPKHLTSYLHEIRRTLLLHFVLRDDLVVGRQPTFPNESWVIFYYDRILL